MATSNNSISGIENIEYFKDKYITFGKYKGKSYRYIYMKDKNYCDWLKLNIKNLDNIMIRFFYTQKIPSLFFCNFIYVLNSTYHNFTSTEYNIHYYIRDKLTGKLIIQEIFTENNDDDEFDDFNFFITNEYPYFCYGHMIGRIEFIYKKNLTIQLCKKYLNEDLESEIIEYL